MEAVVEANTAVLAIFDEACQVLGSSQTAIPQAGLPLLDTATGQSHWDFLKTWYREQGVIRE